MATPTVNLALRTGKTFKHTLIWKDPDTGDPISLAGCIVHGQMRDRPKGKLLLDLTVANGRIVVEPDGTTGQIDLHFTDEETASIPWPKAEWDLKVTFPNGESDYVCAGHVAVAMSVTP